MPKIRGIKPETWTDETFVELSPLARLLFIGLWNYACDNGHLEDRSKQIKMRVLPADNCNVADLLRELENHGRIVREGGWITVPTLAHHQRIDKRFFTACDKPGCARPGTEKANPEPETRRAHVESTTGARGEHVVDTSRSRGDCDVEGDGDGELMVITSPTTALAVATARPDVQRLIDHLAQRIHANGGTPKPGKRWEDAARLMLDNDGLTETEIHGAIDWCQADEFWRANILSMPKLREKYDQLRLQAQRRSGPTSRVQETNDIFDRAARRMGVVQ
jgi:hypothetical protein